MNNMRKITKATVNAFLNRETLSTGNTVSTGDDLRLHRNKIAEHRADGIYITTAGWETKTTLERLNGIPGVYIYRKKGDLFLNGILWDGDWIKISQ